MASRLVHRARARRQCSQLSGLIVAESLGGARSLFERLLVAGRQGPGAGPDEAAGPTTPWSRRRRCSRGAASSASASGSARWLHPRRSCCRRPSSSRLAAAARSSAAAACRYWRRRSGSGWWPSSLRPCLPLEGSRGAVAPLRALLLEWRGVGGERREERDMLGLLTALERAGSRPGVFALLVPGRWSGPSREPPVCPWPSKRMPPPVTWRCWVVVCWDGRSASTETEARSSVLSLDLVAS